MSVPLVAFRPHFPWTIAIATTNGDIIIRHLPTSRHKLTNEFMIYMGHDLFTSLRWSRSGDFLIADDCLFEFKHDEECTFVRFDELRLPRLYNAIISVSVDKQDNLNTFSSCCNEVSRLPNETKDKIAAICAAVPLCSSFVSKDVEQMASLLLFIELNAVHSLY
jgi:hypothetical protein